VFIVVPDQQTVSDVDYFGACAKIAATPEGKVVIAGLRLNLYEALNRRCPEKDVAKRSEWLKAHEAIVDARRTFLRHFTHPQEFLRQKPKREMLPVMGREDQE